MFGRLRKGRMLIEMLSDFSKYREFLSQIESRQIPRENKYQFKNNFSVRLETSDFQIEPIKVTGFCLSEKQGDSHLAIRTSLHVGDWIDDFKSVDFAEIALFDNIGNVSRIMSFDISYIGHSMAGDHFSTEIMAPIFDYEILS